jgi:hypothetical protein
MFHLIAPYGFKLYLFNQDESKEKIIFIQMTFEGQEFYGRLIKDANFLTDLETNASEMKPIFDFAQNILS